MEVIIVFVRFEDADWRVEAASGANWGSTGKKEV
jgi:hypothetical protein